MLFINSPSVALIARCETLHQTALYSPPVLTLTHTHTRNSLEHIQNLPLAQVRIFM
jgi:hypothetical protein